MKKKRGKDEKRGKGKKGRDDRQETGIDCVKKTRCSFHLERSNQRETETFKSKGMIKNEEERERK